jgi:SpoVK/Ycf46/Vps4 family AAA+-type ATPase
MFISKRESYFKNLRLSYEEINEMINEQEGNDEITLLDNMDRIVHIHSSLINCEDEELELKFKQALNWNLTACSNILEISTVQALLFSLILESKGIDQEGLAVLLRVSNIKFFSYSSELNDLKNKRLIRTAKGGFNETYHVPVQVIEALKEGKAFTPPSLCNLSKKEFFKYLDNLFEQYLSDGNINLDSEFFNLFDSNKELDFVKNIYALGLEKFNLFMLSKWCADYFLRDRSVFRIGREERFFVEKDGSADGYAQLFSLDLIEFTGDDFVERDRVVLTHKTLIELLGMTQEMLRSKGTPDLINYEEIQKKELFYNEVNANQIKQLSELLMEKNYIKVKERLKLKGLRTGFICLFFGIPGTGKTETVFQIARMSERNIMSIDISATKSHWFGDSEKIIKNIFSTYRQRVIKAEKKNLPVPILLLNEADAVINKRKDTATSGVAQTENAIQNIILEELEKLEGIMIATTNLTENIDTAFDRRFIYKLEFQKPKIDTRKLIWKSIIPELSIEDAQKLATNYDFTGGQIENIARKRTINDILNEKESELSDLFRFCNEETSLKNDKKIGF